jgi:hypothetical protein
MRVVCNSKTFLGFHTKCPIVVFDFNKIWSLWACYKKSAQYVTTGGTALDLSDMTKLIGVLRDYAYTYKNGGFGTD